MARPKKKTTVVTNTIKVAPTLTERLQSELQTKQSVLNLVLGLLIVFVAGFLLFNYFNRGTQTLGPAQQTTMTETAQTNQPIADVEVGKLPGQYTVKTGDTLFVIAQKYYSDGWQFQTLADANKLTDVNLLEVGQTLTIPKLPESQTTVTSQSAPTTQAVTVTQNEWGPKIEATTYTVVEGDWLSTIAARAYGDVYSFDKIAKANNLTNPNIIEPGIVLQIPR